MKILIVEPWFTGSHQGWAEGYQASSQNEVSIVSLPGELWRWRLRGGALPLGAKMSEWIDLNGQPDLVIVSGLVDVAELLGLARRNLSPAVPVVIYQHESQLVYPVADGNFDSGAALRNWMSWCAADLVLFNSYYHMRTVIKELPRFVSGLPDNTHEPMVDSVMSRFEVFPVGVDMRKIASPQAGSSNVADEAAEVASEQNLAAPTEKKNKKKKAKNKAGKASKEAVDKAEPLVEMPTKAKPSRVTILWPHRWERDKDPEAFRTALKKLKDSKLDFGLVLAGQDPPSGSAVATSERQAVESEFGDRIIASGDFSRAQYLKHIARCDLVVSCAKHEFFGVAAVEAIASGCVPLLPNHLSYPELIRPVWHETTLYEPGTFGKRLVGAVENIAELKEQTIGLARSMRRFSWDQMAQTYDSRLSAVVERARSSADNRPSLEELQNA